MRKKSIAVLMALTLGLTGCGAVGNTESSSGGTEVTADVDTSVSQEPVVTMEETNEQTEVVATYPKLSITSDSKTYRSEEGKDLCYYDVESASVNSEDYKELATSLEQWFQEDESAMEELAEEYTSEVKELIEENSDGTASELTYSIAQYISQLRADSKILSMGIISSEYRGGAHGSNAYVGATFDVETGKELVLSDVIVDQEAFESIALSYILNSVETYYGDGLFPEYEETITNGISSSDLNWVLTEHGFQVIYNEYEIAPYAASVIRVDIPYSLLEDCMNSEYLPEENAEAMFEIDSYCAYQLNLNGSEQEVTFTNTVNEEDYYLEKATISIGGTETDLFASEEPTGYYYANCFYLKNTDGIDYFILELAGDNDCKTLTLFQEKDGVLTQTDTLESSLVTATMHPTEFECGKSIDVFGTYEGRKTYTVSANGQFVTSDYRYHFINPIESDSARILTSKQEIALVIDEVACTLAKDAEIYPTGADDDKLYFQTPSGEEGYIEYDGTINGIQTIDGVEVTELFDGIQYAG